MRIAIIQPSYIPWLGFFHLLQNVDALVHLCSVQFTRRDWRNRNLYYKNGRPHWLTIPVNNKGNYYNKISDITINDLDWKAQHLATLKAAYFKNIFNGQDMRVVEALIGVSSMPSLSDETTRITNNLIEILQLGTLVLPEPKTDSQDPSERLAEICEFHGAKTYVSGPTAASYLNIEPFGRRGINVSYFDYKEYLPEEYIREYTSNGSGQYPTCLHDLLTLGIENVRKNHFGKRVGK